MNAKVFALAALVAASLTGCASTSESETDAAAAAAASTSGPDAAASASMSPAHPAHPAHPVDPGQPFSDMDTNKDGMLSKDELAGNEMLTQHFVQADTDGNGSLSQAEVDSHRAAMAGKPD